MKTKMEDIDKLIKETLTQEEAKFYDELEEQNVFEMFGGLFKGKNTWLIVIMNVSILAMTALWLYFMILFFETDDTNELITWGFAAVFCFVGVAMMKTFSWMQMDKNALIREIKRLELQVSSLAGKITG